jgi:hypothetical protein
MVLVTPANDESNSFTVSVLAITTGGSATAPIDNQEILRGCSGRQDYSQCVLEAGIGNLRGNNASRINTTGIESIQNAHVTTVSAAVSVHLDPKFVIVIQFPFAKYWYLM